MIYADTVCSFCSSNTANYFAMNCAADVIGPAALTTVSCFLSICGALVIFGTFIAIPEIRNFTRKLIVCLTVADFLTASGYLASSIYNLSNHGDIKLENTTLCVVQSAITTYSSLVSFYLTIAIGGYLFVTVVYKVNSTSIIAFASINSICWLIPGGIILTALLKKNVLGANPDAGTGPWCWVQDLRNPWMWFTGKAWEIICYLLTISFYMLLKFYVYLKHRLEGYRTINVNLRDEDQNFLYVWLILYILRLWGTIRLFLYLAKLNECDQKFLVYFQALGDPGQAFCNCILFCLLDKTVRSKLFRCSTVDHTIQAKYEAMA